jgi:hypothetical protein
LLIAAVKQGKLLSELNWRDFEKLVAQLLEKSGWKIELTQGSKGHKRYDYYNEQFKPYTLTKGLLKLETNYLQLRT